MELSRRFRALRPWLSLRYHGLRAYRESIRTDLHLARRLAAAIDSCPELERLAPVPLSAVCFRHRGDGMVQEAELDRWNHDLLLRVIRRGRVFLSNATIRAGSRPGLLVNHRTTEADVDAIVRGARRRDRRPSAGEERAPVPSAALSRASPGAAG
jgi:glutamate/tyrosine decarboxylase-like PLP-dependent enzyme